MAYLEKGTKVSERCPLDPKPLNCVHPRVKLPHCQNLPHRHKLPHCLRLTHCLKLPHYLKLTRRVKLTHSIDFGGGRHPFRRVWQTAKLSTMHPLSSDLQHKPRGLGRRGGREGQRESKAGHRQQVTSPSTDLQHKSRATSRFCTWRWPFV